MAKQCLDEGKQLIKEYSPLLSFDSFDVSRSFAKINSCIDSILAKCPSEQFVIQHRKEVQEEYERGLAKPGDSAFSTITNKKTKKSNDNIAKKKSGKTVEKVQRKFKRAERCTQKLPADIQAISSFNGYIPSGNSPLYGFLSATEIEEINTISNRFSEIFSNALNECNQSVSAILLVSPGDLKVNSHKLSKNINIKNPAETTNITMDLLTKTLQKMYFKSTSKQR